MKISIGCDHRGFALKQFIVAELSAQGHGVIDHGCYSEEPVDFPDVARAVCESINRGAAHRGVMLCGSGVGAAIACNKIAGIRSTCIHDVYSAHQCVEHDDVNVACIGADIVGAIVALELLNLYLKAEFSTDPDVRRRVQKLAEMDSAFAGSGNVTSK